MIFVVLYVQRERDTHPTKGHVPEHAFRKAIDELDPYLSEVILFNYGEPFLNPEIYEMIAYARKQDIRTVSAPMDFRCITTFLEVLNG